MALRPFPNGETLTLVRRVPKVISGDTQYDDYGNVLYVETTQTVVGCPVWPNTATEVTQSVDRTNTRVTAMLPPDVLVDAVDAVRWRGKEWEIEGEAEYYRNPHTGTDLQTILMARVEG